MKIFVKYKSVKSNGMIDAKRRLRKISVDGVRRSKIGQVEPDLHTKKCLQILLYEDDYNAKSIYYYPGI